MTTALSQEQQIEALRRHSIEQAAQIHGLREVVERAVSELRGELAVVRVDVNRLKPLLDSREEGT